jgi:hypothetical protein
MNEITKPSYDHNYNFSSIELQHPSTKTGARNNPAIIQHKHTNCRQHTTPGRLAPTQSTKQRTYLQTPTPEDQKPAYIYAQIATKYPLEDHICAPSIFYTLYICSFSIILNTGICSTRSRCAQHTY